MNHTNLLDITSHISSLMTTFIEERDFQYLTPALGFIEAISTDEHNYCNITRISKTYDPYGDLVVSFFIADVQHVFHYGDIDSCVTASDTLKHHADNLVVYLNDIKHKKNRYSHEDIITIINSTFQFIISKYVTLLRLLKTFVVDVLITTNHKPTIIKIFFNSLMKLVNDIREIIKLFHVGNSYIFINYADENGYHRKILVEKLIQIYIILKSTSTTTSCPVICETQHTNYLFSSQYNIFFSDLKSGCSSDCSNNLIGCSTVGYVPLIVPDDYVSTHPLTICEVGCSTICSVDISDNEVESCSGNIEISTYNECDILDVTEGRKFSLFSKTLMTKNNQDEFTIQYGSNNIVVSETEITDGIAIQRLDELIIVVQDIVSQIYTGYEVNTLSITENVFDHRKVLKLREIYIEYLKFIELLMYEMEGIMIMVSNDRVYYQNTSIINATKAVLFNHAMRFEELGRAVLAIVTLNENGTDYNINYINSAPEKAFFSKNYHVTTLSELNNINEHVGLNIKINTVNITIEVNTNDDINVVTTNLQDILGKITDLKTAMEFNIKNLDELVDLQFVKI
jgi:hypothetical protein